MVKYAKYWTSYPHFSVSNNITLEGNSLASRFSYEEHLFICLLLFDYDFRTCVVLPKSTGTTKSLLYYCDEGRAFSLTDS